MKIPKRPTLGILVGGGPAPGINGIINSAALQAMNSGFKALGIINGFEHLSRGDNSKVIALDTLGDLGRIHFLGGSILGTSRSNPTKTPETLAHTVRALENLGITHLLTIGGDGTAYAARKVSEQIPISVLHVPKTIDNDLPLPGGVSTFGFQTARHFGCEIVKSLMTDAKTTGRWYLTVAMGRKAGHLALSIGKATGATLSIIPEDFIGKPVSLEIISKVVLGSILKRMVLGKEYGVAMLAEGLIEMLTEEEHRRFGSIERDEYGRIRYADIDFGATLKHVITTELVSFGIKLTVVGKDIGYELRSVEPIPYDKEYVRDLGYAAFQKFQEGVSSALIAIIGDEAVAIPFADLVDPATGRTKVRMVNPQSFHYQVAQKYMIKLQPEDFKDLEFVRGMCALTGKSEEDLRAYFSCIIE